VRICGPYALTFQWAVARVFWGLQIVVNNVSCPEAHWVVDPTGSEAQGLPYLNASMPYDTAGTKAANITVTVVKTNITENRTGEVVSGTQFFVSTCKKVRVYNKILGAVRWRSLAHFVSPRRVGCIAPPARHLCSPAR
jgi:hypothetical protein